MFYLKCPFFCNYTVLPFCLFCSDVQQLLNAHFRVSQKCEGVVAAIRLGGGGYNNDDDGIKI